MLKKILVALALVASFTALAGDDREFVGELVKFRDNGNKITLRAPSGLAGDYTFTLPPDDGSDGQHLRTNGSGVSTWSYPMTVGNTLSGGATGGVLFVGSGPILSQDATNLIWDDTNNRLGIGTTPSNQLHIVNAASSGTVMVMQSSAATTGNMITIQRNGGGTGRGILIQNSGTTTGNSIEVQNLNATSTIKGIQVTQSGLGGGVTASTTNASSTAIMVGGITSGAGQGLYGEVNGTGTGTAIAAVKVSTTGRALAIVSGSTGSYVALNAKQTPSFTSYELTLPDAQASSGQVLQATDGSGTLSWATVTPAIGGTLTGSTTGRVLFGGASTTFDDDDGLFYDDATNRLGVNTSSPGQTLTVAGNIGVLEGGGTPTYHTIFQGGDQSADITYTLPINDGDADQVLTTNGSGTLSWAAASSAGGTQITTIPITFSDLEAAGDGVTDFYGDAIPDNAIILRVIFDVTTAFSDDGSNTSVITVGLEDQDEDITDSSAGVIGVYFQYADHMSILQKLTAARQLAVTGTLAGGATEFDAGAMDIYVEWVQGN